MVKDSLVGLERTLAFANKMLIGGLGAASASTVAGVLYRLGSTEAIPTPMGVSAPPILAAIIFPLAAAAFGFVVLLALKNATQLILGSINIEGTIDPNPWMKEVQAKLYQCPSIITSPLMVRAICALSIFLLYLTIWFVLPPNVVTSNAQFGTNTLMIYIFLLFAPSPYYFIILKSLVMFKPSAYQTAFDTGGSMLLEKALNRNLELEHGRIALNLWLKRLQG